MRLATTVLAIGMLVSASAICAAQQETVATTPTSPIEGGKVMKAKVMTATGAVKTVTADSLAINDGPGKDWTFVIDAKTKIIAKGETLNVTPVSPIEGGKVIASKTGAITDIKEGQRVQVKYREVEGKLHATQVKVM